MPLGERRRRGGSDLNQGPVSNEFVCHLPAGQRAADDEMIVAMNQNAHFLSIRLFSSGRHSMSVVFAAGFLVPQQFADKDYFRGAKTAFPDALFPPVPPVADVSTRAGVLANRINGAGPSTSLHTSWPTGCALPADQQALRIGGAGPRCESVFHSRSSLCRIRGSGPTRRRIRPVSWRVGWSHQVIRLPVVHLRVRSHFGIPPNSCPTGSLAYVAGKI